MAPECSRGTNSPTLRTDLYSFGLVIYELFTGRRAFEATTLGELALRLRREIDAHEPGEAFSAIDTRVERAILRCLEQRSRAPAARPHSRSPRRSRAAMLLAAVVAAGRTPSPELVAAAHTSTEGLRPAIAWRLSRGAPLGVLTVTAVSPHTRLVPALSLPDPPADDGGRARAKLAGELGAAGAAADRTFGYEFDESAIDHVRDEGPLGDAMGVARTRRSRRVRSGIDESHAELVAARIAGIASPIPILR